MSFFFGGTAIGWLNFEATLACADLLIGFLMSISVRNQFNITNSRRNSITGDRCSITSARDKRVPLLGARGSTGVSVSANELIRLPGQAGPRWRCRLTLTTFNGKFARSVQFQIYYFFTLHPKLPSFEIKPIKSMNIGSL